MEKARQDIRTLTPLVISWLLLTSVAFQLGTASATRGLIELTWNTKNAITQHPLPHGSSQPWSITVSDNGSVWFAEAGANRIGEINPVTYELKEFEVPTPDSMPVSVSTDHSGRIWFAELNTNRLGFVSSMGAVVDFPLPSVRVDLAGLSQKIPCGPASVNVSPSNTVWVACLFSNELVEYNPETSKFAEFPLPVFQSGPVSMVFSGDNIWFTAADANMIGHALVSQLRNGSSNGISEWAPINQTYIFRSEHPTGFLGGNQLISSSLPTPSGIALSQDGRKLWITEHVDSSFDSYDVITGSLVRYWTSKTNDAYGFPVSFPNGIATDKRGNIWIAEHYGNKIAEFNPDTGQLTETSIPCCDSMIAGVYSLAVGKDGTVWFVEINGNAIGELRQVNAGGELKLEVPADVIQMGQYDKKTINLGVSLAGAGFARPIRFDLSGVSSTGELVNASASFKPKSLDLGNITNSTVALDLSTAQLNEGVYYLTVGLQDASGNAYSSIIRVSIVGTQWAGGLFLFSLELSFLAVASIALLIFFLRRAGRRRRK